MLSGKSLSQLEAPFSEATSFAHLSVSFKELLRFVFFWFYQFAFFRFLYNFFLALIAVTGS